MGDSSNKCCLSSTTCKKKLSWKSLILSHIFGDILKKSKISQMFDLITSWLPQNSPSIPIPGKIFRFLKEFCFSSETDLLIVDTSLTATTYFVLPCALEIIVLVVSGTTISQGWKLALAHSSVNTTSASTNLSLLVAFIKGTCPIASAVKIKDVRANIF